MRKGVLTTFSSLLYSTPHLFFLIWNLYLSILSLLPRPCQRLSEYPSFIYPAIHPSQLFEQELAGIARALFPTPNIEGLTE